MSAPGEPRFQQVRDDYAALEPGRSDTWNPLLRDVELEHRIELMRRLVEALRVSGQDYAQLKVLDVGCGNGRSTRMYLELGIQPSQLTGIDLRPDALDLAKSLNPAVRWLPVSDAPWPIESSSVSWVSLCTVFSSIKPAADRQHLANEISRVLKPAGQLFFWDRKVALDFAGGDALLPTDWFSDMQLLWHADADVRGYKAASPTHGAWLLQRP
ncbi:MAG: SAM-dependent methyltransferase [Pseudohongiellaceae bacterium]|jgi:SAM-dependent methyltransferase